MAKLTPEQKAQNKQHAAARNAAFNARRKAYRVAYEEVEKECLQGPEHEAFLSASQRLGEAQAQKREHEKELLDQIAALKEKISRLPDFYGIPELNERRIQANKTFFEFKNQRLKDVSALFPDVEDVYSAAQWEALGHFNPQAEASK